jgi:hypothetical protein
MMTVWEWSGKNSWPLPSSFRSSKKSPQFCIGSFAELLFNSRPGQKRLGFCGRIVAENIFFSEGDKVVLGKVSEFWFRGFKRKDLPDKFIRRSLGNSRPYLAAPVSERMNLSLN